ncbi:uncharacterized protein F5147DRAFT_838995 [Suillus discolor]|uniref:C2H2-type domain-containing protein n=1 Tax=Suillus discolor TaxID=1912936 RepID=A0A9P7JQU2_9AGAM|nr:uncharacterized protein F5147DRAFT_838995 [Suillus discolor]KAG2101300.1 hypothetical protein F5147DRAFT_838995 [Suillus discolor]
MQYPNPYSHNGHQTQQPHVSAHHPRQSSSSSNSNTSAYPQQAQVLSGYPLDSTLSDGIIGNHHTGNPLQPPPFSNHPQHGTSSAMDTRRSYYAPPSAPPPAPANQPNAYYASHHQPSAPSPQYAVHSHPHIDPQTLHAHSASQHFIPTPSQTYQVYSNTVPSNPRSRSTVEPYYHMSPNPQHTTQGSSPPAAPRPTHTSPSANPALIGDRFPCELCDRSFTRSHDRRRHYETVHAATPVLHRCRYCGKDFSRADSLKRHIDNGCDEMSHK